jgi:heme/copper-type cytochrome/quinol oxidase subunit 2
MLETLVRLIALKVCGAIAVLVLVAMFGAIARRRALWRPHEAHHTTAFSEYVWAAIPWLIFAAGVLPAVRLIVARSDEAHDTRAKTAAKLPTALANLDSQHDKTVGQ